MTSKEEIPDKIASNTTAEPSVEQEQIVPGFEADVENDRVK